jgi:hypothetical protein
MTLLTAHRILIGAAVLFFAFYAGWEIAGARGAGGGASGLLRGASAVAAAIAFGVYFRTLRPRAPGGRAEGRGEGDDGQAL